MASRIHRAGGTMSRPTPLVRFEAAYLETALWSSTYDKPGDRDGAPSGQMDDGAHEWDPESLARMRTEAEEWYTAHVGALGDAIISEAGVRCGPDFDEWGRAGHDFWLTRNGHGAGFWDGDWPEPWARQLTDAAHAAGNRDLYIGDDGLIYLA